MRKNIILFLKDRLKTVPGIRYIGIWNEQLSNITGTVSFPLPAVFIHIDRYGVRTLGNGCREADVPVMLHIITRAVNISRMDDKSLDLALADFDLIDKIDNSVVSCSGDGIAKPMLIESDTDHDHAELCEYLETFLMRSVDRSAVHLQPVHLTNVVIK